MLERSLILQSVIGIFILLNAPLEAARLIPLPVQTRQILLVDEPNWVLGVRQNYDVFLWNYFTNVWIDIPKPEVCSEIRLNQASHDGSLFAASCLNSNGGSSYRALMGTREDGFMQLSFLPSEALAISENGEWVSGWIYDHRSMTYRTPFRYHSTRGLSLPQGQAFEWAADAAYGISNFGHIMFGTWAQAYPGEFFRWSAPNGYQIFRLSPQAATVKGFGMSTDGNIFVGTVESPSGESRRIFSWDYNSRRTIFVDPPFPYESSRAEIRSFSRSADRIFGDYTMDQGKSCFVWDAALGSRDLRGVLVTEGMPEVQNFEILECMGAHQSGRVFALRVRDSSGQPHELLADLNINCQSELVRFLTIWEAGLDSADLDQSGGVDGQDLEIFFRNIQTDC